MFQYWAYGLGIHSAFLLPELEAVAEAKADVVIRQGSLEEALPQSVQQNQVFWSKPEEIYFFWDQVGRLLVREGREIIVDLCSEADEALLRLNLLGAGLAVLLYQRGYLVLHASSIAIQGQVVAFLGEKGQGKSTLAATLFERGHALVADDAVPVDMRRSDGLTTVAGFPQFKLWPDAIAALGYDPTILPRLNADFEKRSHRITTGFTREHLPLQSVIVLTEGASLSLKQLSPQDAFPQLMKHWYLSPVSAQLLQGANAVQHLQQITTLIRCVPVYCLERPRSLALLPKAADLIENTFLTVVS
jgi:hypothetical protein